MCVCVCVCVCVRTHARACACVCMCEECLALSNQREIICHKTKPNLTKSYIFNIYVYRGFDIKWRTIAGMP